MTGVEKGKNVEKKKFSILDCILNIICVVFVAEAAAPAAAIGNSQYFWWAVLIIAFLLPYGMIVSELGSTYADDEAGVYDWVKRAFGPKVAGFVGWCYWLSYPTWVASLAVIFPDTITMLTGIELNAFVTLAIELVFIWAVTFMSFSKASDSVWIVNLGAILKVGIAIALGVIGFMYMTQHGNANAGELRSYLPDFSDTQSLTYLSIILFNFMGFEVLATYTDSMENPQKQIPQAIIAGGIAIAVIYLISAFGIGAAIPAHELTVDSGITDASAIMLGEGSIGFTIINVVFLVTLVANMVSWALGVNSVACMSAKDHNLPSFMAYEDPETSMPNGAAITDGVFASILCVLSVLFGLDFWAIFATQIVVLLLTYVPMFPAFLKLREIDPDRERPYRAPGKGIVLKVMTYLPVVLLVLSIIATAVPLDSSPEEMEYKIPILVMSIVLLVIGAILMAILGKKYPKAESEE